MEQISLNLAQKISSPRPFGLVVSIGSNNKVNVMGISWWTYVSRNPSLLLICLSNKNCTNENIRLSKEFSLCLPSEDIKDEAWKCSTTSGRNINKIKQYNLEVIQSNYINTPILRESYVAFECKVVKEIVAGDHTMFLGEILNILGDTTKKPLYSLDDNKN